MSPTIRLQCVLKFLTAASNRPPKFGEHSGINFHWIALAEQNWRFHLGSFLVLGTERVLLAL